MVEPGKFTPMMNQYLEVKNKHLDAIVFYRLGDFYEMFFDDAKIASNELDLVLTGRNAGVDYKVPMCGIPYHAASGYIQRLITKGYKVAIVEQMENPAEAQGIVKREVIKIVTPGTIMDEVNDERATVQIAAIHDLQYALAIVLCEMTTGEMKAQIIDKNLMAIQKVLLGNNVREVVIENKLDKKVKKMINDLSMITVSFMENAIFDKAYNHLIEHIEDERIKHTFGLLINYLLETQKRSMSHLNTVEMIYEEDYLQMDYSTRSNLELTQSLRNNGKSLTLWSFLDKCQSAMGSRTLRKWIEYPLIKVEEINKRADAIDYLNANFILKDELKEALSNVYDLERLSARIAYGSANPRDIVRLVKTLKCAPIIFNLLKDCKAYPEFQEVDSCSELCSFLDGALVEEPPVNMKDGGIFVDGYHSELDEVRKIGHSGKQWILDLETKEKERTQIKSLKIGYNRIFGYYIEVTKANIDQVKEEFGYVRKQTLTNAERFVTQELKEREDLIVHAQERMVNLEIELFNDLLDKIRVYLPKLHVLASSLSQIDALYSLAVISNENGYTRPIFHSGHEVYLEEARHPILDKIMKETKYVSNDLKMNEDNSVLMITGPNMGGKSTYMRQNALIVLMAQIGCYVPAKKAELPIFDQIFTRIGANDDIMSGQSTFMVEMIEANNALQNATSNSLILFDEIGRGTSTYDGMALAHAMIEYITNTIGAKTLFSTHYHELTALADNNKAIQNVHVEVHEENDTVTFLYRVKEGKADKSYGINVARLAHLPNSILARAKQLLDNLELQPSQVTLSAPTMIEKEDKRVQKIETMLGNCDLNEMTPMAALTLLCELKSVLTKEGK
ncbi:MAG: DNA mismatch repair protein MutS [Erysipelotrichaceae bacterium]